MTNDIQDPLWTAYSLGELSQSECEKAEQLLGENPTLAAEVATLTETLEILKQELSSPTSNELDPLRREAILQHNIRRTPLWIPTAFAAILALGFGISHLRSLSTKTPKNSVLQENNTTLDERIDMRSLDASAPASAPVMTRELSAKNESTNEEVSRQRSEQKIRPQSVREMPSDQGLLRSSVRDADAFVLDVEMVEPTPTPTPTPEPGEEVPPPPQLP